MSKLQNKVSEMTNELLVSVFKELESKYDKLTDLEHIVWNTVFSELYDRKLIITDEDDEIIFIKEV